MPNISSLTMPDGIVYSIKDSIARKEIEEIKKNGSGSGGSGGSGGGRLIVGATLDGSTFTFDKTAREIINAMKTVGATFVYGSEGAELVADFSAVNITSQGIINFTVYSFMPTAQTLDDYPTTKLN